MRFTVLLLIFIGLIIGAIAGGAKGAVWGAIIGGILGSMATTSTKKQPPKAAQQPPRPSTPRPSSTPARSAPSTRTRQPLRWVGPNVPLEVKGYQIPGGLVYLQPGAANEFEPSAIGLNLNVATPAVGLESALPYWPAYATISPAQRGTYLQWLAQGRRDNIPAAREFGYLFLFFYGLERRVLLENDYSPEIGHEIANLVTIYAPHGRSKSLPSYFCQLLHFWAHRQGDDRYAELWPWILELKNGVLDEDELQLVLGNIAVKGGTVPAKLAREIAYSDSEAVRSNVTTRSPEEFARLFDERFAGEFPAGLPVEAVARQVAVAEYRPASAVLREAVGTNALKARTVQATIPGPARQKLISLWNTTCTDLLGYMRAKAKSTGKTIDLATLVAMPEEFRRQHAGELVGALEQLLAGAAQEDGLCFIAAGPLFSFFGEAERETYTLSQSRKMAAGLSALGWSLEPDPNLHGVTLSADSEVVLFREVAGKVSSEFLGHCGLVQLSAAIAGADGNFDLRESETLSLLIENASVGEPEKIRLRAWNALLGRNLDNAPGGITKVTKAVPKEKAQAVAHVLCRIASADGIVTKNEERALQRIFKNLGLTTEMEAELKQYLAGFNEVTVTTSDTEPSETGETIPPRPVTEPKFTINRERLQQLKAETAEVIHILSVAMADSEMDPATSAMGLAEATAPITIQVTVPSWCATLKPTYAPLTIDLVARESWTRAEFDVLARAHHLIAGAAYDAINEWSDEALGDFLLTGEDPVHINRDLVPPS